MIDKRLLAFAPDARKYIFLNVFARWLGLLCGALIIFVAARFVSDLFAILFGRAEYFLPPLPALGVCAFAALARALFEFLASKAAFRAQAGVKKKLRTELYAKLLTLGGNGASGAETVQVAVEGVDQIENYFGRYLPQFFYSMAAPLTLFALLAPVSLSTSLILFVCTPLIPLLILLIMRMAKKMMRKQLKSYTSLGDFFLEALRGMTTLKIYGADGRRHDEMNDLAESFRKSTMRVLRMQLNSIVLMDIIAYGGAALGVILVARGFLAGDIGLAGAIMIVLLAAEFFIPLRQLGSYFHVAMNGLAACERVFQVLDMPEPADGKSTLPAGGLAAEADDLSFAYGEGRAAALSQVSFSAPACGLTGLTGASGCGKSTFAGLLSGRLPAADCEGVVKVGGVSLCDVKRSELRKRVCLVTHEDYIFTGTVSENLRMAKPDAADDELAEALGKARLRDFFAERDGLGTELSEGGANLSGGQRQRLSLARALLRNADLYIFDEATSNIDSESEETVLTVIRELAKTKNVILISHRLANLTGADTLYAMEGGRVAETGTHAELLSANGVYARLFREQKALEAFAADGDNPDEEGVAAMPGEAPGGAAGSADDPNVMTGRGSSRGPGVAKRLASFVKPMAGIMALAILLGAAGHAVAILLPVLGGFALLSVDGFAGTPSDLGGLFAALIVCAVLRGVFRYAEQLCNHYVAFKLLANIRDKVFAALRRLCPAKLECREKGDLIAVITGDIELLEVFYAHTISPVAIAIIVSAAAALFIGSFHPLLGAAAACSYVLIGACLPYFASLFGVGAASRLRDSAGRLSSYYLDSLRGAAEILGMGIGDARKDGIGDMSDKAEALQRPVKRKEGAVSALSGLFVTLCSLWMLALSYMLLLNEAAGFEVKGVIMPFIVLFSSFGPVLALANLSSGLPGTLAAARRVFALLDETPETEDVTDGKTPGFEGAECRNLSFAYEEGDAVLQDISAVFSRGGITGVTGRSGSGKSTLLRLLMRFWKPPGGSVLISGEDVNGVDTAHLRTLEGFMTQETDIFSDTVENNIKIGKPEASRAEVIAAAKKAALHDFVMTLPEGYDTRIGGAGTASAEAGISGGERQRIGLARAFLHDAPFLLLDEPTSNLDSLNEAIILSALREEGAGRTVALVSHRKSTMSIADRVYSADSGRLS